MFFEILFRVSRRCGRALSNLRVFTMRSSCKLKYEWTTEQTSCSRYVVWVYLPVCFERWCKQKTPAPLLPCEFLPSLPNFFRPQKYDMLHMFMPAYADRILIHSWDGPLPKEKNKIYLYDKFKVQCNFLSVTLQMMLLSLNRYQLRGV